MGFVRFTGSSKSFAPRVSISNAGLISFSRGALNRFKLAEFQYGILYYDHEERLIAVQLTNDENAEGARRLRKRQTGADISGRTFIDYFGIHLQGTMLYHVTRDENTGYLLIDLKKGKMRGAKAASVDQPAQGGDADPTT